MSRGRESLLLLNHGLSLRISGSRVPAHEHVVSHVTLDLPSVLHSSAVLIQGCVLDMSHAVILQKSSMT